MAERFPASPIRLVVSDVDGTLVTRDKRLTPRVEAAIEALKAHGVLFTIISARPPLGIHKLIDRLRLAGPVGAVNGGALIRADGSIIERRFVPEAAARASVAYLRSQGLDPWLFTETQWFLRDPAGAHVDHERTTLDMPYDQVDEFTDQSYAHCLKIVGASHDHPHLAKCEIALQAELGTTASATRSQSYYLDVTHPEAIKGNGVAGLARLLGLDLSTVLSIGDGTNDISMLQRAGFSVAMGNGSDAVQNSATVVTDDNEHDGFATAIERYVLADPRRTVDTAPPRLDGGRTTPTLTPNEAVP